MKESKIEKPKIEEEEMKKSKEISVAEKEKLPSVFMIYRDNDLFKEWIPKITETLKELGRKVEIQSFPAGTEKEEIEKWVKEHKDEFEDKKVLSDGTLSEVTWGIVKGKKEEWQTMREIIEEGYLDGIFDEVTNRSVLGKAIGNKYELFRKDEEEIFTKLTQRILEERKNLPAKVYIFLGRILDHGDFYRERKKEYEELKKKKARIPEAEWEYEGSKELKNTAGEKLKQWLVKGGIPTERIVMVPEKDDEQLVEKADRSKNWFIIDRHRYAQMNLSEENAKKLMLPVANFYRAARKYGLIKAKPEELERLVREILKEDFGKKSEEEK